MTRNTFKSVVAAALLSATVAGAPAQAYFAVSLPGSAITMSGVGYPEPAAVEAKTVEPAAAVHGKAQTPRPKKTKPRSLRASGAWLQAPVR